MKGIDFGIDKLYEFSIATRDLADKLLDIYDSKVNEKTNSLITKLTILTAISAPLTIITGIYGMNFTRDLADKLLDIYDSKVNEKTNSLITKLTILTAISAPLTIITGIYGMNFKYMPELGMAYGYPITIVIMILIILIGIHLFKKNGML